MDAGIFQRQEACTHLFHPYQSDRPINRERITYVLDHSLDGTWSELEQNDMSDRGHGQFRPLVREDGIVGPYRIV